MISLSNIGSLTVTAVVTGDDDDGWWKLCLVVVVVVVGVVGGDGGGGGVAKTSCHGSAKDEPTGAAGPQNPQMTNFSRWNWTSLQSLLLLLAIIFRAS